MILNLLLVGCSSQIAFKNEEYLCQKNKTFYSLNEANKNKKNVVCLYLGNQELEILPNEIYSYSNLKVIDVSKNNLIEISEELQSLKNLTKLILSNNVNLNLIQVFNVLEKIPKLNSLYLDKNQITSLPTEVSYLKNIKILSLHSNNLTTIPIEIVELRKLKKLLLSGNKIKFFPEGFNSLNELEILTIDNNLFDKLPEEIIDLTSLRELYFGNKEINLNESFNILSKLKKVELIYITNTKLSNEFSKISSLKHISTLKKVIFYNVIDSVNDIPREIESLDFPIYFMVDFPIENTDLMFLKEINPNIHLEKISYVGSG